MKKTFKVVMLPTEKASIIHEAINGRGLYTSDVADDIANPKHLYILSDEQIKEGDWFTYNDCLIKHCTKVDDRLVHSRGMASDAKSLCRKIVATTDKSLGNQRENHFDIIPLPQLPESFIKAYIKAYNECNPITEVDLSCKEVGNKMYDGIPETRPDNTVIVHQSKMYSRDEVRTKVLDYFEYFMHDWKREGAIDPIRSSKWFDDNL